MEGRDAPCGAVFTAGLLMPETAAAATGSSAGFRHAAGSLHMRQKVYLPAMHSGMHLSEQLRAQVGDCSSTTGMLMVRQKKVRNAPATRYVSLTPIAVEAYNQLAAGKKAGEPLCTNTGGGV